MRIATTSRSRLVIRNSRGASLATRYRAVGWPCAGNRLEPVVTIPCFHERGLLLRRSAHRIDVTEWAMHSVWRWCAFETECSKRVRLTVAAERRDIETRVPIESPDRRNERRDFAHDHRMTALMPHRHDRRSISSERNSRRLVTARHHAVRAGQLDSSEELELNQIGGLRMQSP